MKPLNKTVSWFYRTPEITAIELRLSFADVLIRAMAKRGWTARQLADKTNFNENTILDMIHADHDLSFTDAGRLLFVLGVRVELVESETLVRVAKRLDAGEDVSPENVSRRLFEWDQEVATVDENL